MELKDVILSTIEELENSSAKTQETKTPVLHVEKKQKTVEIKEENSTSLNSNQGEKVFLENIKERTHVLFEGFQSPNNVKIEAKVDLTLNFLEYMLSTIETRLSEIKK